MKRIGGGTKATAERGIVRLEREWGKRERLMIERLREIRRREASQNRFAARIGVPASTVSDWFSKTPKRRPGVEHLWRVAELYEVSIDWLLGFDVPMNRLERTRMGELLPALRAELHGALKAQRIKPTSIDRILPAPEELWASLVGQYKTVADYFELRQRDLDATVEIASLKHIAADTEGRVFDVSPIKVHQVGSTADVGDPPPPRRTLTSSDAKAALRAMGVTETEDTP
jgi:transcriptional regulator with XRE-family HTH domain